MSFIKIILPALGALVLACSSESGSDEQALKATRKSRTITELKKIEAYDLIDGKYKSRPLSSKELERFYQDVEAVRSKLETKLLKYIKKKAPSNLEKKKLYKLLEDDMYRLAAIIEDEFPQEQGFMPGKCQNTYNARVLIYGPDYNPPQPHRLYGLPSGNSTKDGWDCDGVFVPVDRTASVFNRRNPGLSIKGPAGVKISNGQQLIIRNGQNSVYELSEYLDTYRKGNTHGWVVPNCSQAEIVNYTTIMQCKGN